MLRQVDLIDTQAGGRAPRTADKAAQESAQNVAETMQVLLLCLLADPQKGQTSAGATCHALLAKHHHIEFEMQTHRLKQCCEAASDTKRAKQHAMDTVSASGTA